MTETTDTIKWGFQLPKHTYELQITKGFIILLDSNVFPVPNAFHRMMQRIYFGFKYKKL